MANIQQGTLSNIKNKDLVDTWISLPKKQRKNKLVEKVLNLMRLQTVTKATKREFEKSVGIFCAKINIKWQTNFRRKEQFLAKESKWLNSEIYMTSSLKAILRKPAVPGNTFAEQSTSRGRPYVAFGESSEKTKKRRIEELVSKYTLEELSFAVKELSKKSNSQVEFKEFKKHSLTLQETLALYLQLELSQRKYNLLRSIINSVHSEFLPSIYKLRQFRDSLLPKDIITTEQGSEINLQQLLDYTLKSILKSILDKEYIKSETLTLTSKYGFDGGSGHSTYKQLRIDLEKFNDLEKCAQYGDFNILGENTTYKLGILGVYDGTASDSFKCHADQQLSTGDRDNDEKLQGS
ncbi:uncharacterized protein LOC128864767 [Anastrepha ludens]|uniref:uncharacterized protein LOC128864767 n=1 Tax=Anastrepha ludens TaxID=28586 RepID=UPI0023B0ED07|nr:uncharacterized protein LOC128864767 [Anastrepha ludens]